MTSRIWRQNVLFTVNNYSQVNIRSQSQRVHEARLKLFQACLNYETLFLLILSSAAKLRNMFQEAKFACGTHLYFFHEKAFSCETFAFARIFPSIARDEFCCLFIWN